VRVLDDFKNDKVKFVDHDIRNLTQIWFICGRSFKYICWGSVPC